MLLVGWRRHPSSCAASHLADAKVQRLLVANRTLRARAGAGRAPWRRGAAADRNAIVTSAEADIVISATASRAPVIAREAVAGGAGARRHRPMFLLDPAVPRDIEPAVAQRPRMRACTGRRPRAGDRGQSRLATRGSAAGGRDHRAAVRGTTVPGGARRAPADALRAAARRTARLRATCALARARLDAGRRRSGAKVSSGNARATSSPAACCTRRATRARPPLDGDAELPAAAVPTAHLSRSDDEPGPAVARTTGRAPRGSRPPARPMPGGASPTTLRFRSAVARATSQLRTSRRRAGQAWRGADAAAARAVLPTRRCASSRERESAAASAPAPRSTRSSAAAADPGRSARRRQPCSWKCAPAPAATKRRSSPATCSACTRATPSAQRLAASRC